jgi:hypothetical protein
VSENSGKKSSGLKRELVLISLGLLFLVGVSLFGWYQFKHRANQPIGLVKEHVIETGGATVGDTIQAFLESKGVVIVSRGFKPSWGAEETSDNVFVVSFVYEVGREANWVSWKVDLASNQVTPLDDWATELWQS